jgi:hypothetical protein
MICARDGRCAKSICPEDSGWLTYGPVQKQVNHLGVMPREKRGIQ